MNKEVAATGNIDVTNLKVRSRNWIYARSTESFGGNLKFDKPETQEAVSRILKYAKDKEKGSFNPSRERDELSLDLRNNEHSGRTRGLWKRTTWKHGFEEDRHMYKNDLEAPSEGSSCKGARGARTVYGATNINDAAGRTSISWQPSESS